MATQFVFPGRPVSPLRQSDRGAAAYDSGPAREILRNRWNEGSAGQQGALTAESLSRQTRFFELAADAERVARRLLAEHLSHEAVLKRLAYLRAEAQAEGDPFDNSSEAQLIAFLRQFEPTIPPAVFLLESGNLRAEWHEPSTRTNVGLQFRPDGKVQYVVLQDQADGLEEALGVLKPAAVRTILAGLGLGRLWGHGGR